MFIIVSTTVRATATASVGGKQEDVNTGGVNIGLIVGMVMLSIVLIAGFMVVVFLYKR